MRYRFTNPAQDPDGPKVYVGAYVPFQLYHRLVAEAEQAVVSRSEVIRQALAQRYEQQAAALQSLLLGDQPADLAGWTQPSA